MMICTSFLKSVITMFGLIAIACAASAQSFSVQQPSDTAYGSPGDSYFKTAIKIYNLTSANLPIRWVRTQQLMPPTWRTSVCNEYYCFSMSTDSAMVTITPGDSDMVEMHFYPFNTSGSAVITVDVYVISDPSERVTLTFYGNAPVGVDEYSLKGLNIYPNPATDKLWIDAGDRKELFIEIYNALGQQVKNVTINVSDRAGIEIADLYTGYYLAKIRDEEGRVVVKKFVKQ